MGYRNYSVANGLVVDKLGNGDFTTIQSAINSAVSGQTIFIRPGTYTENPVLKTGVDIVAFVTDSDVPNVIINGKCTFTGAGTIGISGIELQTNSDFCLAVTGSSASIVYVNDCFINALNNTGISYTSSSASSSVFIVDCKGNLATTGIGLFASSGAGIFDMRFSDFTNTGASTTASTTSGAVNIFKCIFASPFSTSSGGVYNFSYCNVNSSATNTTALTLAGTGNSTIDFSGFISGTASALSIGTGTILNVDSACRIESSNTNAINGTGQINYGTIQFTGTSNVNNVTTQNSLRYQVTGGWSLISTLGASVSASLAFTTLPTYSTYAFVINNLILATNTSNLEMVVSSNNGGTYAVTGYTAGINYTSYNSATVTNVNSTTFIPLTSAASNGVGISGTIFVTPNNGSFYGQTSYLSTTSGVQAFGNVGGEFGIVANAFKFLSSSGNLTSGTISLYGINN